MILRQSRDTRMRQSHAWSFIALNWAYLGGLAWWVSASIAAATGSAGVPFKYGAPIWFAASALSITWLLAAPSHRLCRVLAVGVPATAALSRLLDFIAHTPTRWNGVISWAGWFSVWLLIMPRFLPPPLRNGARHEFFQARNE